MIWMLWGSKSSTRQQSRLKREGRGWQQVSSQQQSQINSKRCQAKTRQTEIMKGGLNAIARTAKTIWQGQVFVCGLYSESGAILSGADEGQVWLDERMNNRCAG